MTHFENPLIFTVRVKTICKNKAAYLVRTGADANILKRGRDKRLSSSVLGQRDGDLEVWADAPGMLVTYWLSIVGFPLEPSDICYVHKHVLNFHMRDDSACLGPIKILFPG